MDAHKILHEAIALAQKVTDIGGAVVTALTAFHQQLFPNEETVAAAVEITPEVQAAVDEAVANVRG